MMPGQGRPPKPAAGKRNLIGRQRDGWLSRAIIRINHRRAQQWRTIQLGGGTDP